MRYSRLCYFVWSLFLASLGCLCAGANDEGLKNHDERVDSIRVEGARTSDSGRIIPKRVRKEIEGKWTIEDLKARFMVKVKERSQKHSGGEKSVSQLEVEALIHTAMELKRQNRFDEALEAGNQAIAILKVSLDQEQDPMRASNDYAQLGMIYEYVFKDFKHAAESYQSALDLNPGQGRAQDRMQALRRYLK